MTLCPHGREMNTNHAEIFVFAGPIYTCACCHAHWGGYQGDPNTLHYCGTCSGPKLGELRYVDPLRPSPERVEEIRKAAAQRKKFGAPHEPISAATSAQTFSMLPFLSIGDYTTIQVDTDPPKPWWKRLLNWWWYGNDRN